MGSSKSGFFEKCFTVGKNAKKPGLLGILTTRVAINRVFMRILRYRAKRWEKNQVYEGFEPQVFLLAPR
jgi:hypothetical protein